MYEAPSVNGRATCIITPEVVINNQEPVLQIDNTKSNKKMKLG